MIKPPFTSEALLPPSSPTPLRQSRPPCRRRSPRNALWRWLLAGALAWGAAPALAQTNQGPQTLSGNTGGKAPTPTTGAEGNFFLDTSTYNIYGPKSSGVWPTPPVSPPGSGGGSFTPNDLIVGGPGATQFQDSSACTSATCVLPSNLNLTGNLTLTGAAGPTQASIYEDITVVGPSTSTSGWQSYWFLHAVDSAAANGNTPLSGLDVRIQLTGSIGLRNAIESYLSIDTQPNAADASTQNYVSMSALGYTQASAKSGLAGGGTFAGYAGSLWGANPDVFAASGAVHWMGLYGEEDDTNIMTGADVAERYDTLLVHQGTILATIDDAAIEMTGTEGNGIEFGGIRHGYLSTGTLISGVQQTQGTGSPRAPTAAVGIDLRAFTFTTMAIESAGFTVDPTGQESALNLAVTGTTCATNTYFYLITTNVFGLCQAGTPIAAFRGTSGTFFNRTTAVNAGDMIGTSNTSNSRLGLSLDNASTGTTATTDIELGNVVTTQAKISLNSSGFSGGQGANALVISNTGATPIVIGAGTETLKFGSSGMFAANGAVVTTVTSLGPTGSHTTIQGWTTFLDNTGTQRWQPYY